jgi:cytochrome o ubiquinol oxidase subunit 1
VINSGLSLAIASSAFIFGFAVIWHIWWMAAIGLVGIVLSIIIRTSNDDNEYKLSAAKIAKLEKLSREQTP